MSGTTRTTYRGWNITATCLKHFDSDPRAARRFTARAFAELDDPSLHALWHDAGVQTVSIVNHLFISATVCSQTLLTDIKAMIDKLSRTRPNAPLDLAPA